MVLVSIDTLAANRLKFLGDAHRLLKPGGQIALHVHSRGQNFFRHEGRVFLLGNFIKSRFGKVEPGDKFLSNYRGIKNMYIHIFTETEIVSLLARAGFEVIEVLALNRRRNGLLKSNRLRGLRANGFILRGRRA